MKTNIRNRKKIRAVILTAIFLSSIVAPPFNNVGASLLDARNAESSVAGHPPHNPISNI